MQNNHDHDHDLKQLVMHYDLPLAHRMRAPLAIEMKDSPCLILLHGLGANEAGLVELAKQQDPRLTVILVRSPIKFGTDQFGFFQVNFTADGPVINAAQAEQSRQLLCTFIEGLPNIYGIDAKKIWVTGFSQGGILSASLGLTRPDLVQGFAILSGRILPEINPSIASKQQLEHLHVFVSHGIQDTKLSIEFARKARAQLDSYEVDLKYKEYSAGHELNSDMQQDFRLWVCHELDNLELDSAH